MNELINPRGDAETSVQLCEWIHARKLEILREADAIKVTPENWNSSEVKDGIKHLSDIVEDLRDKGKALVREVLAEADAQRVITQIDPRLWNYSTKPDPLCVYAQLSARLKALKDAVAEQKELHTPKPPAHTYVIQAMMTDKDLAAVVKVLEKCGAQYRYQVPQSDAAARLIEKYFENNK